jgi:hypothetical protein
MRLPDGGVIITGEDAGDRTFDGGGTWNPDGSGPVNACSPGCGPAELCGDGTVGGNGLDDNCNGQVDEGCSCTPGETRPCFAGPPDRRNVGACADGIEACTEFGIWGTCSGGVSPGPEVCNGADDDCNDITDDLGGCSSSVMCPGNEGARPLTTHTLRGSRLGGVTGARNWSWSISCPASVPAELCPSLATPNAENTDVYFSASGAYRVTVRATLADGSEVSCAWSVYVQGGGLRVELNWDTMATEGTDVDLHLHRWTRNGVDSNFFEDTDDCYYQNCQPDDDYSWPMHADTALENCSDAPHGGGAEWRTRGACRNPRLDVDTNGTDGACRASETNPDLDAFCAPENINVDEPVIGMPYRIMVNYYGNSGYTGPTYASVNIFCGGALRGAFGLDPLVTLDDGDSFDAASNDSWYVADVVFFEGTCGLDCRVFPIGTITNGVSETDPIFGIPTTVVPFGPAWSCDYNAASRSCD